MDYTLSDSDIEQVRFQLGANLSNDDIGNKQILSETVQGSAVDYVYAQTVEGLEYEQLTIAQKAIMDVLNNGTSEDITNFISGVLLLRQRKAFARAIVFRTAGNCVSIVKVVAAQVVAGISQRQQITTKDDFRKSLYDKADEEISFIRDSFPDAIPDEKARTKFRLFDISRS